jgi:hypothetical protein
MFTQTIESPGPDRSFSQAHPEREFVGDRAKPTKKRRLEIFGGRQTCRHAAKKSKRRLAN